MLGAHWTGSTMPSATGPSDSTKRGCVGPSAIPNSFGLTPTSLACRARRIMSPMYPAPRRMSGLLLRMTASCDVRSLMPDGYFSL